jgi:type VI protein secretion system component VasK
MAYELRAYLQEEFERTDQSEAEIPASDRVVTINHNNPAYQDVMQAMRDLQDALQRLLNSSDDPTRTERQIKEVQASRTVLEANSIRENTLRVLIVNNLKAIWKTAKEEAIKLLAKKALDLLVKLFSAIVNLINPFT